jgi:hypothetical protein
MCLAFCFPVQLLDEAAGDNPQEQRTRDEHEILPSDVSPLPGLNGVC